MGFYVGVRWFFFFKKEKNENKFLVHSFSFIFFVYFIFFPPCMCTYLAVICLYHDSKFHWEHEYKNEKSWSCLKVIQNIGQFWKFMWSNWKIFCFLYKNMIVTLQNCQNDTSKGPKIIWFTLNDILIWWKWFHSNQYYITINIAIFSFIPFWEEMCILFCSKIRYRTSNESFN